MNIRELRALPMFKAHEKEIRETAIAMATGLIPATTASQAKAYRAIPNDF